MHIALVAMFAALCLFYFRILSNGGKSERYPILFGALILRWSLYLGVPDTVSSSSLHQIRHL